MSTYEAYKVVLLDCKNELGAESTCLATGLGIGRQANVSRTKAYATSERLGGPHDHWAGIMTPRILKHSTRIDIM